MRRPAWSATALCLALLAAAPGRAAAPDLKGAWKLVLVGPFNEQELLLLDFKDHDGKVEAEVTDFPQQFPQPPKVSRVEAKDAAVSFAVKIVNVDATFRGKADRTGAVLGLLRANEQNIPARLEKATGKKLAAAPNTPPRSVQAYFAARSERDAKARVAKLREIVAGAPGSPTMERVYADLVRDADAAGLADADVRKTVDEWTKGAQAYGPAYAAAVRTQALQALTGKKAFAPLAYDLAREADAAAGPDTPLETRAEVAKALAEAATLSSHAEVATAARAKAARLETELDEQYHQKVPPFKPEAHGGAKGRKSDRVVLLELFTGAQCPPCVAADVAFDALNTTYGPTELVSLQYHLHIPGPDPLTTADSVTRAEYYPDIQGTPTTLFDGKALAAGGGPMANSKGKYDEYREIIDGRLAKPPGASIDLKVDRDGDTVTIAASAKTAGGPDAKDGGKVGGSKPRLRLALIEEQVRYVGGNGLRFHHHVVRALPGGVDGKALADGKAATEVSVKLSDLRKSQESYLSDFTKKQGQSFPKALPPIDLSKLSVVAFVQDDGDKSVLNARLAPVAEAK